MVSLNIISNMGFIKKTVKAILPYGIIAIRRKILESRTPKQSKLIEFSPCDLFIQEVKNYIHGKYIVQYDKESKFRHVVTVQGYGRTGSSAIIDLFREYSNAVVLGYIDVVNSKANPKNFNDEVTFMRDSGGLAEIEKHIGSNNRFNQDAVLHRFILLTTRNKFYKYNPEVRPFFYRFFADIAKIQEPKPEIQQYNPHLSHSGNIDILSLKKITVTQYRQFVRSLLMSVFNTYYRVGKEILVLDQFFQDSDYSDCEKRELIPNLKTIVAIRDPRDVFAFIRRTNLKWIPYDNPDSFVDWYRDRNIDIEDSEIRKTVRFEDLMDKYDITVNEIEKHLSIKSSAHTEKFTCFDPNLSRNSYMLWKKEKVREQDYSIIAQKLKYLCHE